MITNLTEQIEQLQSRQISSKELTLSYLEQIKKHEKTINALNHYSESIALKYAEEADQLISSGQNKTLTGVPIIHKDNLCTTDFPTTASSKILDGFIPPYNAFVVKKTIQEGMVCIGKASCDEFAMGSTNETSFYGKVCNPYEINHIPGGSSGGSAACVAARFAPLATGSDTGGSVRQPASFCNLTGLKPTYGYVSRFGLIAFASSLDQIGPMAQTARDCAYLMDVIAGHDPMDSTSSTKAKQNFIETLDNNKTKKLSIGIPKQLDEIDFDESVMKTFDETIEQFKKHGHDIKQVDLAMLKYAVPAYYVIAPAEASSNLARYNGALYGYRAPSDTLDEMYKKTRSEGFGDEVKRRILLGNFVLSKGFQGQYYEKAINVKKHFTFEFSQIFEDTDFLLTPTTSLKPLEFGQFTDPIKLYAMDALTIPANLVGLPAVSFQAGFDGSLPIGMQLIGRHFSDPELLRVVDNFQKETNFHLQSANLK